VSHSDRNSWEREGLNPNNTTEKKHSILAPLQFTVYTTEALFQLMSQLRVAVF
jgi:hypothetical protein